MLDLDHPMTPYIFAAARLDDAILECAKSMTLVSTPTRQELLSECLRRLDKIHWLNEDHFAASPFVFAAIEEMKTPVQALATVEVNEAAAASAAALEVCPVCGTPLTQVRSDFMPRPEDRLSGYCSPCLSVISPARQKLDSSEGFGTWAI